jgi:hypothetical protein
LCRAVAVGEGLAKGHECCIEIRRSTEGVRQRGKRTDRHALGTGVDARGAGWANEAPFHQAVYDTLLHATPDAKIEPWLATSWSYNTDKTVLTMKLRTDVKFTDGTPFDASAAAQNIMRFASGTPTASPQKSTLINVVSGHYRAEGGRIVVGGVGEAVTAGGGVVRRRHRRRRVGRICPKLTGRCLACRRAPIAACPKAVHYTSWSPLDGCRGP